MGWVSAAPPALFLLLVLVGRTGDGWMPFLDGVNLLFHEAGHPLFGIFGWESLTILGGTLMQVLILAAGCRPKPAPPAAQDPVQTWLATLPPHLRARFPESLDLEAFESALDGFEKEAKAKGYLLHARCWKAESLPDSDEKTFETTPDLRALPDRVKPPEDPSSGGRRVPEFPSATASSGSGGAARSWGSRPGHFPRYALPGNGPTFTL